MPPKKPDPKKNATGKKSAATAKKGGKAKKKKWSKVKTREKLNNLVLFDEATLDRLMKEAPAYRLVTPAILSERLKINVSLARFAINHLESLKKIQKISRHNSQLVFTRAIVPKEEETPAE
eukprot:TRINITY_DN56199_c0_g1_i1.p1 TRINITY_DN56199_c0_g1~~TRINITY_DN56199_c0_g1_i1.p1  ORF type:complete len:121 (+),score=35.88 TRINITY_DN56199_c0_g1_i1:15-377(+)